MELKLFSAKFCSSLLYFELLHFWPPQCEGLAAKASTEVRGNLNKYSITKIKFRNEEKHLANVGNILE